MTESGEIADAGSERQELITKIKQGLAEDNYFPSVVTAASIEQDTTKKNETVVIKGSGQFLNQNVQPKPSLISQGNGEVTLNFELADIRDVIKVVFDSLGENYILDPRVQGEVTVQTNEPLPKELLIPTLETLLQTNGATIVKTDGIFKILPISEAVRGNLSPQLRDKKLRPGYSVQVFPLRYMSATEMQTILQPFAPEGGILLADPVRNLLILAGTSQELSYLAETVELFDVNWLKGMSVGMYVLENIEAQEMAQELDNLFGPSSQLPLAGLFRFLPINRLNAVLAITPQADFLDDVSIWIERLDGSGGERLYVYQVQFSNAEYLASLLNQIFEGNVTSSAATNSTSSGRVAPNRTGSQISTPSNRQNNNTSNNTSTNTNANVLVPLEENDDGLGLFQIRETEQQPGGTSGSPVSSTSAPAPATTVSASTDTGSAGLGDVGGDVRVIADTENNALLIWASRQSYDKILNALREIDVSPRQVLIEATIAEVTLGDSLRYGLQWWFKNNFGSGRRGIGSLDLNTNVNGNPNAEGGIGLLGSGFGYAYAVDDVVRAFLNALAADSRLKVLSSPQLLVLDNQQANIRVGDDQPVLSSTTVGDNTTTQNIQFRETGVLLDVTPNINAGGMVTLEINQEVTDVGEIDEATEQRSFLKRSVNSKVAVRDGETIVLGGLIRESDTTGKSGVPGLYNLPLVGPLFGSTTNQFRRTELVILITPRVIHNSNEAASVTNELKERMRGIIPLESPWKKPLIKRQTNPFIPVPEVEEVEQ